MINRQASPRSDDHGRARPAQTAEQDQRQAAQPTKLADRLRPQTGPGRGGRPMAGTPPQVRTRRLSLDAGPTPQALARLSRHLCRHLCCFHACLCVSTPPKGKGCVHTSPPDPTARLHSLPRARPSAVSLKVAGLFPLCGNPSSRPSSTARIRASFPRRIDRPASLASRPSSAVVQVIRP